MAEWQPVEVQPVKMQNFEEQEFIVWRNGNKNSNGYGWQVAEAKTGALVGSGNNKLEAIKTARTALNKNGREAVEKAVAQILKMREDKPEGSHWFLTKTPPATVAKPEKEELANVAPKATPTAAPHSGEFKTVHLHGQKRQRADLEAYTMIISQDAAGYTLHTKGKAGYVSNTGWQKAEGDTSLEKIMAKAHELNKAAVEAHAHPKAPPSDLENTLDKVNEATLKEFHSSHHSEQSGILGAESLSRGERGASGFPKMKSPKPPRVSKHQAGDRGYHPSDAKGTVVKHMKGMGLTKRVRTGRIKRQSG